MLFLTIFTKFSISLLILALNTFKLEILKIKTTGLMPPYNEKLHRFRSGDNLSHLNFLINLSAKLFLINLELPSNDMVELKSKMQISSVLMDKYSCRFFCLSVISPIHVFLGEQGPVY